ncbi:unnamed protein product, partial [Allacma fusca]
TLLVTHPYIIKRNSWQTVNSRLSCVADLETGNAPVLLLGRSPKHLSRTGTQNGRFQ